MFRKSEKRHNRPETRDEILRRRFKAAMQSPRRWL